MNQPGRAVATVIAVVDDLMFSSKIRTAAAHLNQPLVFARSEASALAELKKHSGTQFDSRVVIRQTLTSDYNKLEAALSLVDTPSRSELSRQPCEGTSCVPV